MSIATKTPTQRELRELHEKMWRSWDGLQSDPGSAGALAEWELRSDLFWEKVDALAAGAKSLNDLTAEVHEANKKWWISLEDGVTPIKRNKGELIALMHSELSEALEGERKDLMDDKLPHRKMAEVELADTMIRIFDYAGGFGYDLQGAYEEKMRFNAQREDHKHEARKIAGGKQF